MVIFKGIIMFAMGAFIALIASVIIRDSPITIYATSYTIGFLVCLVYGLSTKG